METIQQQFKRKINNSETLFVPYIMAGDGGVDQLEKQMLFLEECGAAAIEVGVPFSDPIADGPTIQAAGVRSLQAGTTLQRIFDQLRASKEKRNIPTIIMAYMNVIYAYGIKAFADACVKSGVQGLIVPDVPLEEESIITPTLKRAGVEWIRLVALTSSTERIKKLTHAAEGFMYTVAETGTTGVRTEQREDLYPFLGKVTAISPVPVLVGFGISSPEQVHALRPHCDGVIVGSKIVDLLHEGEYDQVRTLIESSIQ